MSVAPLAAAVRIAFWAIVTDDMVDIKLALVAPEATVTEVGTETAEMLLESATVSPPEPAGAVRITVQLSVPAPVIESLIHVRPLSAPGAVSPVPLSTTVRVSLPVVSVIDPVCVPGTIGANCSSKLWLFPPAMDTVPLLGCTSEKYCPAICGLESCTAEEPLFVTNTLAVAVCPTATDPKAIELVETTSEAEEPPPLGLAPVLASVFPTSTVPHPETHNDNQPISTTSSGSLKERWIEKARRTEVDLSPLRRRAE